MGAGSPEAVSATAPVDVVILAGGHGSRLGSHRVPKPLVAVGGRPLLEHVITQFRAAGFSRFVIALGHGSTAIRQWFADHDLATVLSIDVSLVDTGAETETAGRVAQLGPRLSSRFFVANADGLSTLDLNDMLAFHADHGRLATVAAVRPAPRFGYLTIDAERRVGSFAEKSPAAAGWINGGYWVLESAALDRIEGDSDSLERDLAPNLAADGQLMAHLHDGFWECVDTPADLEALQARCDDGDTPWRDG